MVTITQDGAERALQSTVSLPTRRGHRVFRQWYQCRAEDDVERVLASNLRRLSQTGHVHKHDNQMPNSISSLNIQYQRERTGLASQATMAVVMMPSEAVLSLQSARLELEYERALHEAARIYEAERLRAVRVQMHLLEDEHDEAKEQTERHQNSLRGTEEATQTLRDRTQELESRHQQTQHELQARLHEIDNYQAELNAVKFTSNDTSKILTEKLALTRELSHLKPELEHLRAQVASSENVLADKLALQRELATAHVELENERRIAERYRMKAVVVDPGLAEELEGLKQELAKERKALQKLERQSAKRGGEKVGIDAARIDEVEELKAQLAEARRNIADAKNTTTGQSTMAAMEELKMELETAQKATQKHKSEQLKLTTTFDQQKEVLENKLDAFRTKLRSTKDQLKAAQDELERREQQKFADSAAQTKARLAGKHPPRAQSVGVETTAVVTAAASKKRSIARFDPDMTIGTPGNGAAAKRAKTNLSIGDKSTFSITPFLNRTISVPPESPAMSVADMDEHSRVDQKLQKTIESLARQAELEEEEGERQRAEKVVKKGGVPASEKTKKARPLKDAINADKAMTKKTALTKPNTLAQVAEEEDEDGEEESAGASTNNLNPTVEPAPTLIPSIEDASSTSTHAPDNLSSHNTNKPKMKRLNSTSKPQTSIFETDPPEKQNNGGIVLGGNKFRFGGVNSKQQQQQRQKITRVLAEFSPLKRDRRAISVGVV